MSRDLFLASDFVTGLCLRFEDGSSALFKHAFCLKDEERDEIAVFTEHCGYHIFPLIGTEIDSLNSCEVSKDSGWPEEMFRLMDKAKGFSDGERWTRSDLYRY